MEDRSVKWGKDGERSLTGNIRPRSLGRLYLKFDGQRPLAHPVSDRETLLPVIGVGLMAQGGG